MKKHSKSRERKLQSQAPVKRRRASPRERMERELGRKLLAGEIPVVPPSQLHRCPVPSTHVNHDVLCKDYEEGRIGYDDVLKKVGESLPKKSEPETEPNPEGGQP